MPSHAVGLSDVFQSDQLRAALDKFLPMIGNTGERGRPRTFLSCPLGTTTSIVREPDEFVHQVGCFRRAFPDLNFWGTADLIAEGDYVVGQWEGGGTHTGPAFSDFLMGSLPPATGRKMHFTGTTVLRIQNGKITQEIGLDDGVKALTQLGLIRGT